MPWRIYACNILRDNADKGHIIHQTTWVSAFFELLQVELDVHLSLVLYHWLSYMCNKCMYNISQYFASAIWVFSVCSVYFDDPDCSLFLIPMLQWLNVTSLHAVHWKIHVFMWAYFWHEIRRLQSRFTLVTARPSRWQQPLDYLGNSSHCSGMCCIAPLPSHTHTYMHAHMRIHVRTCTNVSRSVFVA